MSDEVGDVPRVSANRPDPSDGPASPDASPSVDSEVDSAADSEVDAAMDSVVRAALARHLPQRAIRSFTVVGEGLDNRAYDVDGELIVRVAKDADPDEVRREADLLTALRDISPLPVPEPVFVDPEAGILAY